MPYNIIYDMFMNGLSNLIDYLATNTLICLVPAFFIVGALNAFVDKESVMK